MQAQNHTIQTGLKQLGEEVTKQVEKDNVLRALGWGAASQYSANFIDWIYHTKTSCEQFKTYVQQATLNRAYKEYPFIWYDPKGDDVLELQLDDVYIYFESIYFEDFVGPQKINLGTWDCPMLTWISAREYLEHNWETVAKDYILDNLHRAEIEQHFIDELIPVCKYCNKGIDCVCDEIGR